MVDDHGVISYAAVPYLGLILAGGLVALGVTFVVKQRRGSAWLGKAIAAFLAATLVVIMVLFAAGIA